jgi:voltage-gated potassium channel
LRPAIGLAAIVAAIAVVGPANAASPVYRVDHVADGDTITLTNGQRVRFVQIDTPEVYFGVECYGRVASLRTKQLLPPGTAVRLTVEPATDRVDQYGRLLRYVIRARDGLNVNVRLVSEGVAAPYSTTAGGVVSRRSSRPSRNELEHGTRGYGALARTQGTTLTGAFRPSGEAGLAAAATNKLGVWEQSESGRVTHPFEPLILAATLLMIPVLIIQRDASSDGWQTFASVANWGIWAVFAAELVFVLVVAPRKRAAFRAHWLDVAIVVVTVPLYGRLLASLRLVRLVRLMRLARAAVVISRALQAERRLTSYGMFRFVALATVFLVVIAGAVQVEVDSKDFTSFWDGVWWAVVTVTTVGYGDIYPHTVAGRIVAIILMLTGIGFLAVLTATVASYFVKADRQDESSEMLQLLRRLESDVAEIKTRLL